MTNFKFGKKYKNKHTGSLYECIGYLPDGAALVQWKNQYDWSAGHIPSNAWHCYEEYIEPRNGRIVISVWEYNSRTGEVCITRHFNIQEADYYGRIQNLKLIARKTIEWTEGEGIGTDQ